MENRTKKERFFSVELKSKSHLKNVTLTNGSEDSALIEGTLGELIQATFAENVILEVIGTKGTFRMNLSRYEISEVKNQ